MITTFQNPSTVPQTPSTPTQESNQPESEGAQIIGEKESDYLGSGPGPEVMAAGTLEGDQVLGINNEELGEITDIMIDVRSGRVAYAVLSSGGFMGIGNKLFAIPWRSLTLDAQRKCFVLNIDGERLKNAPGFDKNNWPSMADPLWATNIHQYYDASPYWGSDKDYL